MESIRIVTNKELARKFRISVSKVDKKRRSREWPYLAELGKHPYKFDLDVIQGIVKSSGSLKTESRSSSKSVKLSLPKKTKGEKEELWRR